MCDSSLAGDYFRNLADGLTREGVRVTLVELGNGVAPPWLADMPNVTYLTLGAKSKIAYLLSARRLASYLKNENVDILHTHLFYSGLIGVLTKLLQKRALVVLMRHHTSIVRMLGSGLHVAGDKWMAKRADRLLTVSQAAKSYMLDVDGIRRNDIEVVYLGFDFQKLAPNAEDRFRVRREFGFADDDLVLGYVANFAPGKGHLQMIQALEQVSAELPKSRILFVGRGDSANIIAAATGFSRGKITVAGWRDDVSACLNAMDIFVQPSMSEAFSQVLIEAMGVGLPVLATDVGGAREVVRSGVNGILIEPNNVQAIADGVRHLNRDAVLRRELAEAGRATVRERFTAAKMVERHLSLYKNWIVKN